MRYYVLSAAAIVVLALLAWIFFDHSPHPRVPGGPKATGSIATDASNDVPSAWSLLTADDLKGITGEDYQPREAQTEISTTKQCVYGGPRDVTLTIVVGSGAPLRYQSIEQYPDLVPEPDLGDAAIWVPSEGILAVRNAEATLQIEVGEGVPITEEGDDTVDQRLEIARAIAKIVLDRLSESKQ